MTAAETVTGLWRQLWRPPRKLTVSEWADEKRRLSSESSAAAGKWVTRPYQREPMDVFTDPSVHTIVLMVARQTLKTEVINNCIGYTIDQDPGPTLVVQFRDTDCKKFSKIRLAPMLRDTPCLRGKVSEEKSRSGQNQLDYKSFPGGHLSIVASGSPGNLAALPIRYLFCDEIDKYPVSAGAAGDPISLAQGRQEEFWNRKTVLACTPTIESASRIEAAWKESDQREYELKCPDCGEYQIPDWDQVKSAPDAVTRADKANSARYCCAACGSEWDDIARWAASKAGRYRATAAFNGIAGFRVSGLARLGTKLSALVNEYLSKKDSPEAWKTFVNEQLAELWKEKGEAPEHRRLYDRREDYPIGTVPAGGLFLTCGVDVQKDRIEAEIVAWGRGKRSWSVDYRMLQGNPANEADQVWSQLDELLDEQFEHESGQLLPLLRMAVDTGYATNQVYAWCRTRGPRAIAVDGREKGSTPVGTPSPVDVTVGGKKISNGLRIWPVATGLLKSELYGWLQLEKPTDEELEQGADFPPGYCHFPKYAEDYFKQLTSERLVRRLVKGWPKLEWHKDPGVRNEVLDCRVYARAAANVCGIDRFRDKDWQQLERQFGYIAAPKPVRDDDPGDEPPYIDPVPASQQQSRAAIAGRFQRPRVIPSPYL